MLRSTEVAYSLLTQYSQKKFRGKIIDVAEVNQQRWLEEIGQWLENVDRTHLVLARGKPASTTKKEWLKQSNFNCCIV